MVFDQFPGIFKVTSKLFRIRIFKRTEFHLKKKLPFLYPNLRPPFRVYFSDLRVHHCFSTYDRY